MNKLLFIFIVFPSVFFSLNCNAQGKFSFRSISFNLGIQQSNTSAQFFKTQRQEEPIIPKSQNSAITFDLNLLTKFHIWKTRFSLEAGLGGNMKGYNEHGVSYQSASDSNNYTFKNRLLYSYLTVGLNYVILNFRQTQFSISQSFLPELLVTNQETFYKAISYSERTSIQMESNFNKTKSLLISLFFQSSLSKFNSVRSIESSSDYWPYNYGVSIGYSLNKHSR